MSMTADEAIERIKTMAFMCDDFHNCKYGHDCTDGCSEAVKMAVDALQGSVKKKHIGSDNMVISSSDLMTILNTDNEKEIRAKAIDEFAEKICCEVYDDSLTVMLPDGFRADVVTIDYVNELVLKIAEQLKEGAE
jgi:hypothetical protein